ncbi:unnamed protein product, partial [marine sediment metagenome]
KHIRDYWEKKVSESGKKARNTLQRIIKTTLNDKGVKNNEERELQA